MIKARVENLLGVGQECKLLIFDKNGFARYFDYVGLFRERGYIVYDYTNVEKFRLTYEERLKTSDEKVAVIATSDIYVPFDIRQAFHKVDLSLGKLFPNLHSDTVAKYVNDLDLISFAYDRCYSDLNSPSLTETFLFDTVFATAIIERYSQLKADELRSMCETASKYTDWIAIAKLKAVIEYYAAMKNIAVDLSFTEKAFVRFIADGYGKLSAEVNRSYPAIVTKTLDVISMNNGEKAALIVMDGMSLFDFEVLSRHLGSIEYDYDCTYVLIPTTTSISRQSLLSGKYPRELVKPFSLANEEKEFVAAGERLGYSANQIQYLRGFSPEISPFAKLIALIVNDIDDIVHGQRQDRIGMYNDMTVLGQSGNLHRLILRLTELGFSVYITADHGNTPCLGVGSFRSGVEIETRSMRMAVLKDFAEKNALLSENTTEYAGYYLNKEYRYFICNQGVSFDNKGDAVMTHGGMSLDEVIVPFIKIKGTK